MEKRTRLQIFTNGILKENPVLVLVLGTCPVLATSASVPDALGMGIAAAFVLLGSNIVISLLRHVIPDQVRIPCFIVVIAGFVSIVQMLVEAYARPLHESLGIFLPLIVVNCIILDRAEVFASKNSVGDSVLDALGMGIGFTAALFCMATVREILGSGTWCGLPLFSGPHDPIAIMRLTPGGFIVFGLLIAAFNRFIRRRPEDRPGCPACEARAPGCSACAGCSSEAEKGEC